MQLPVLHTTAEFLPYKIIIHALVDLWVCVCVCVCVCERERERERDKKTDR